MALSKFHGSVRERIRRSCEDALLKEGFVADPIEENTAEGNEFFAHCENSDYAKVY